jgi:hypothetical protein
MEGRWELPLPCTGSKLSALSAAAWKQDSAHNQSARPSSSDCWTAWVASRCDGFFTPTSAPADRQGHPLLVGQDFVDFGLRLVF